MKRLFIIFVMLAGSLQAYSQAAKLIVSQSKPYQHINTDNLLYVDTADMRIWAVSKSSIMINPTQVTWLNDSVLVIARKKFVSKDSVYNNPSWIGSLDYGSKIVNKPNLSSYETTSHASATYQPIGSYYPLTGNPSAFLTSFTEIDPNVPLYSKGLTSFNVIKASTDPLYKPISYAPTSSEVLSALGYTPYNSTNPNGYISNVPAQSFASLTGKPTTLSGYGITDAVPNTRTITINGTTFDLSANRSYTVGDVTSASLSSTLSSYVLTSTYTAVLATKQNSLTLTTTGSGASTLVGSTLNIPTPVIPSQYNPTAGTGISISGTYPNQVITNTLPDVSYTAGTGISIASNVITNTAPYIAPVISTPAMALGTSYQAPANKNVWVNCSITHTIALTLLLSSGSSLIQLQTSVNGTTWNTINSCGYSDGVAVAVALNKTVTNNVSGEVPQGYYYRLLATTSGAGSAVISNQQLKTY